jgi:predicted DNA-binding WGR domain protein
MGIQQFTKTNHELNLRRWYVIAWGPTLFGSWAVTRTWGRLGTNWARQRVDEFNTPEEAAAEAAAQIQRRKKRGYKAHDDDTE